MIKREIPSELLFRFSADGDSYKVTGAHYKTLTFIEADGEQFGHKESDALDIALVEPTALEQALGSLNTSLVYELGLLRAELASSEAARVELQRQLSESHQREQELIEAANIGEDQRVSDAELIAQLRKEVELLSHNGV